MNMEWNNKCKYLSTSLQTKDYEELHMLCLSAYAEGRKDERKNALEAYRLRCSSLLGNKCMYYYEEVRKKTCDGNCYYIRKYLSELDKLDGS